MATELIILPTAYRHEITEDQIRHALANVIEVGFEVSESGNLVVYHAMAARPKYR